MPSKEYYWKDPERYREQGRKDHANHYARYSMTEEFKQKNRKVAAEWLEKNRDQKKEYLREYNRKLKGTGDSCENCGFDVKEVLDIHHIIPKALGGSNESDNKVTLCANCHRMIHAGLLDTIPKKGQTIIHRRKNHD